MLETEESHNVGGSECELEAGGDKSDEANTCVCTNEEGGGGKEDNIVGGDGTDTDLVGVYHERRTPIVSVLLGKSTMFSKYCMAFLLFFRKYEKRSILPSLGNVKIQDKYFVRVLWSTPLVYCQEFSSVVEIQGRMVA